MLLLLGVAAWTMAPLATSAIAPVASSTRIQVEVPATASMTPGWTVGESEIELPAISVPGEAQDGTSSGWGVSSNWQNGYDVKVRATTDPALRGSNAVDGSGARSSFQDFRTAGCPCPWTTEGFTRGVFGYSVAVKASQGGTASGVSRWGSNRARLWRGFTRAPYLAYTTAGGTGSYEMTLYLRTMVPEDAAQMEGSYRAGLVVSAHPRL